ncbi:MAG: hypothetical protein ABIG34_05090 [Candidatus Peregrinibacteria bacterium]
MKHPEKPRENPADQPQEAPLQEREKQSQPETTPEQETVQQYANVIDGTRQHLEDLARRLPQSKGQKLERFVA